MTDKMMTRRDFAASLGLAIKGARGRLSKQAHEAILEAEKNGQRFSDSPNLGKSPEQIVDSADKPKSTSISETFGSDPVPLWNGGWYQVIDGNNVSVTGRAACGECGYSLDYQACKNPTAISRTGEMLPVMRKVG